MKYYKLSEQATSYGVLEKGKIYPEDYSPKNYSVTVKRLVKEFPQDWEEVSKLEYLEQESDQQFEEDDWVRVKGEMTGTIYTFKIIEIENEHAVGSGFDGVVWNDRIKLNFDWHEWRKATDDEIKQALDKKPSQEFEKGKWYTHEKSNAIARYNGNKNGTGFTGFGNWSEGVTMRFYNEWREASDDEVKYVLDKERKRRGFKQERKFKSIQVDRYEFNGRHGSYFSIKGSVYRVGSEWSYDSNSDTLAVAGYGNRAIYHDGQWAEPIQQNKIGGYTVEKNGIDYVVGCENNVPKENITRLAKVCKKHDIKIELEGTDVTQDIINLNL